MHVRMLDVVLYKYILVLSGQWNISTLFLLSQGPGHVIRDGWVNDYSFFSLWGSFSLEEMLLVCDVGRPGYGYIFYDSGIH